MEEHLDSSPPRRRAAERRTRSSRAKHWWPIGRIGRPVTGQSIMYVTLLLANFDPLPLSHFVTHPETPERTSHISDPLRFLAGLVQKLRTKVPCTNSISIVREGFCPGVLSGVIFVRSPFCHNTSVTTES